MSIVVLVAVLAVVDVLILAAAGGVLVGIVQDRRRVRATGDPYGFVRGVRARTSTSDDEPPLVA